jgi:hypothetical protein
MAINIQFRRGTAAEWSSVNPILALAEMGIEIDTSLFKIGNGVDNWNDLPYGGLRGYSGSAGVTGSVGNIAVENVLYVSKSGNDLNDGRSLNTSKLTIRSALQIAKNGTTIFVKSGDYMENNPMLVPEGVAVVGDNLRTVTVRPRNKTSDLFWVNNGVYLEQMTFKDYEAPAAAVCFPPDGSAGAIHTSPYVQNCTSITTTGTGMRVDGDHVMGLKSMVVDAFTQYNQGGIGIHMLNRGNTQLVSVFTICCDIGFLCETGGFCSITNANSSFGNFALKADGVSSPLYSGKVKGTTSGRTITLDTLIVKPNVGDAVKFNGLPDYYTVAASTAFTPGSTEVTNANFSAEPSNFRNARNLLLDAKSKIQIDTIDYINETYPDLDYNQFKATRDTGLVIDAVADDLVFGTNYKTTIAAEAYSRTSAANLIANIKTETVDSLTFAKNESLKILSLNYSKDSEEYLRAERGFNIVINAILNGTGARLQTVVAQVFGAAGSESAARTGGNLVEIITNTVVNESAVPTTVFPVYTWVNTGLQDKFTILQLNKDVLKTAVTNWLATNFPVLIYDVDTCERDVGIIVDSVGYDMLFGSNFKSIKAGMSYYRAQASLVIAEQKVATTQAFGYLKSQMLALIAGDTTAETRVAANMDIIIDIITNGIGSLPAFVLPEPTNINSGFANARNLIVANKEFIKAEIIKYIELSYPPFVYNKDKCGRDTGIILDGVYYDIALGTNYNSIVNGRSYLRAMASVVITDQLQETVGAIKFVKLAAQTALGNELISVTRNSEAFAEIIDIIENGEESADALEWSDPGIDNDKRHAREQLQINKTFIKSTLLSWITTTYPDLEYDQALCQRDVGYIVDAISYDVQYGGNTATIEAAKSYFNGAVSVLPVEERAATVAAYRQLASIVSDIVLETYPAQNVTGDAATQTEADTVEGLVEIIADTIEDGNLTGLPAVVYPNLVWVDTKIRDAVANITAAKEQIIIDTLEFIDNTYGFVYNEETCARDVGYIVDALRYDLTYSGNTETLTAARAYYSKNALQIPAKDKLATAAAYRYLKSLVELISVNATVGETPAVVFTLPAGVSAAVENAVELLQQNKEFIKAEMTEYIDVTFPSFTYNEEICQRDLLLILNAVIYDILYGGNSQTADAADEYYSGGVLQIPGETTQTVAAFNYVKTIAQLIVVDQPVTALQFDVTQVTGLPPASSAEVEKVGSLFDIVTNIIENAYTSVITLEEVAPEILDNTQVTFHQYSLITASGHTFEWIGSGTNVNTALPYLGGTPITENQVVQVNGGRVFFTGTDQRGDFRIGDDFVINQNTGTISGRTFTKSLFAVMTPYILAIGD